MWKIELFTTPSGQTPVADFIDRLELTKQAKVRNCIRFLEEFGPRLREPYSKKLTGYKNLFELRTVGASSIRLFYTTKNRQFYIIHAFDKKSNKTSLKEIKTALNRMKILTNQ